MGVGVGVGVGVGLGVGVAVGVIVGVGVGVTVGVTVGVGVGVGVGLTAPLRSTMVRKLSHTPPPYVVCGAELVTGKSFDAVRPARFAPNPKRAIIRDRKKQVT